MSALDQQRSEITVAELLELIVDKIDEGTDPTPWIDALRITMAERGPPLLTDELVGVAVFRRLLKSTAEFLS